VVPVYAITVARRRRRANPRQVLRPLTSETGASERTKMPANDPGGRERSKRRSRLFGDEDVDVDAVPIEVTTASDAAHEETTAGEAAHDDGVLDDDEIGGVVDDAVAEGEANVMHDAIDTDDDVHEASSSSAVVLDDDARSDSARECSSVSASASGTEAERLRFGTSLSQVYRFKDGEYVAVGAAGLAILDCASASKRSLLVYDVEKRPLVRRVIDARLTCELQRDNYVTIHHDDAILFSALTRDESDWLAVAAQITIAQFVARRESLEAIVLDISTEKSSSSGGATLEKGDSVQLNYEAVRGGLPPASEPYDFLALQLFDETSKRVAGLKVKRIGDDDSGLPEALARGIIGCRKDCRRLILAPETETDFVLYDVTVLRMKKPSAKDGKEAAVSGAKSVDEHLTDATAMSERTARVAHSSAEALTQQAPEPPQPPEPPRTPNAAQFVGTPPPPQWWMYNQPPAAMPYAMPPMPTALNTPDQTLVSDVRRAVASLAEDVASLAVRTRTGGAWIPPKPEGEFKHAIEALHKARRVVMLPKIEADALSIGDVKQLTAEAERLGEMHDELRAIRK